jgi:hypothetical protein
VARPVNRVPEQMLGATVQDRLFVLLSEGGRALLWSVWQVARRRQVLGVRKGLLLFDELQSRTLEGAQISLQFAILK